MALEKNGTVLIVEDDEGVARLQQRRIERAGHNVSTAGTIEEAMAKIKAGGVLLILLDYRLPGERTGLDVYAQLKATGHDIPVIMVTGYGDEATVIQALRAGVRDFVTKSVKYLDYLPEAVERVLKQVHIERQLSESEARLATIINSAMDAIVTMDLQDRVLFWNRSAERLYGWAEEEALGRNAYELLFQGSVPELQEARTAMQAGGEWSGELRGFTKDGKDVIVASRWTLIRDDQGRPKSTLVMNTDVTEKKKLEAQFLRAQRMENIGTLAGGIAHDLNNVLTPVLMAVEILQMRLPDMQESLLAPLRSSVERGVDMVKQILSFARGIEGRRIDLQVKHVIRDIEKMLKHTLAKSIAIDVDLPNDLWTICGDATQLSQVLMNLCVNARDAMPEGGRLTLRALNKSLEPDCARLHVHAKPGRYVLLRVADTGTGIPPDILRKIFDPFFTTKEPGKGTGLGLSTTSGIVRAHGGFITVDSVVGKGTEFSVYLPALDSVRTAPAEGTVRQLPCGRGELVLVVDDEASIRAMTKATLEAYGYQVLTACDGTEAVALYAKHGREIRIVLIDVQMPVMDGLATAKAIQKIDPLARIIVMSGDGAGCQPADQADCRVGAFLPKPYTAESLLTTLRNVLNQDPPRNGHGASRSTERRGAEPLTAGIR
jgi:PAS domain S-box-containing protein